MTTDQGLVPEPGQTRTCKLCFETIHRAARACRYCGSPQQGLLAWWRRHPVVAGLFPLLFLVGCLAAPFLTFLGFFERGANFGPYRDQLKVVSSTMSLQEGQRGPLVLVVGKLRNDSPLAWKQLQFEVQFMNESGQLIDVVRSVQFPDSPGVLPRAEEFFSIKSARDFPPQSYASCKVFVRHARDARSRW